jgi:hypothetical protein
MVSMSKRKPVGPWMGWLLVLLGCGLLAACGGGGGGGGDDSGAPPSSLNAKVQTRATPTAIQASTVAGTNGSATLSVQVSVDQNIAYWVIAEEQANIVVDAWVSDGETGPIYQLQLDGQLPVGTHDSEIQIRVCADEPCTRVLSGGTLSVPLRFVVKPNISASASSVQLSRTGAEAAPVETVTLDIPTEAGETELNVQTDRPDAFDIRREGNKLIVGTRQLRAGHYSATVTLGSPSDPRYQWRLPVDYTVHPPPAANTSSSSTRGRHSISLA